jgi:hypothetical protein
MDINFLPAANPEIVTYICIKDVQLASKVLSGLGKLVRLLNARIYC